MALAICDVHVLVVTISSEREKRRRARRIKKRGGRATLFVRRRGEGTEKAPGSSPEKFRRKEELRKWGDQQKRLGATRSYFLVYYLSGYLVWSGQASSRRYRALRLPWLAAATLQAWARYNTRQNEAQICTKGASSNSTNSWPGGYWRFSKFENSFLSRLFAFGEHACVFESVHRVVGFEVRPSAVHLKTLWKSVVRFHVFACSNCMSLSGNGASLFSFVIMAAILPTFLCGSDEIK